MPDLKVRPPSARRMPGLYARPALATIALGLSMATLGAHTQTRSPFAGQARAPQGAVVIGEVVDAATGRGADRAIVRLRGGSVSQVRVADSRGRYYFAGIPAGEYRLTATRQGYFDGEYGRLRAGGDGLPVQLGSGQWMTGARIDLWRPAVIHGVVVDEINQPVIGVRVYAYRRTYVDGRPQLESSGWESTDDQGAYRIAGLLPGDYFIAVGMTQVSAPIERLEGLAQTGSSSGGIGLLFVIGFTSPRELNRTVAARGPTFSSDPDHLTLTINSATPPPRDERGEYAYPRQFFPAAEGIAAAQPIGVSAGEDRAGVSFQILPVLTRRVSGRVIAAGQPAADRLLRLLHQHADLGTLGSEAAMTVSDRDGWFTFVEVPPGAYILEARDAGYVRMTVSAAEWHKYLPNAVWKPEDLPVEDPKLNAEWARTPVDVGGRHVTGLELVMQPGVPVSGALVFEGVGPRVDSLSLTQIPVHLDPISDPSAVVPPARVNASGGFVFPGVMPGRYAIRLGAPPRGWTIRSIVVDGQDSPDGTFTAGESAGSIRLHVMLSTRGATLAGYVRDASAQYVRGATIVVLTPTSRGTFRLRSVRAPAVSPFVIEALPPGEHFVAAMNEATAEGWQAPDRLRELRARATRLVLRESEVRLVDLTMR